MIGAVGPLSQPGAVQSGLDMKWAMALAVSDLDARGGVLGRKVALDFEDTQATPATAAAVAKRLTEDKNVVAVVGEYHSSAALAAIPTYSQAGMPVLFTEVTANAITGGDPKAPDLPPNPKTIFRVSPTSTQISQLIGDWLVQSRHVKNVVHIYEATDYGNGQKAAIKNVLDPAGVRLTQVQVELNQSDYSSILLRLAQEHPDADGVIFDVTGESSFVVEENAFQSGLLKKSMACFVNQVAADSKAFWRAVPDGTGCVFRYTGPIPGRYDPLQKSIADRYQAQFHESPKAWVFSSYDAIMVVADALKRAKSTDHAKVAKAIESAHFAGSAGTYAFKYGSSNPVPTGAPSWEWHQWMTPPVTLLQYTQKNQVLGRAAIVWPPHE
ncbi:MAG: ABC transporter substrate-binding protein [Vulcanimicrobiaceae bacterium]